MEIAGHVSRQMLARYSHIRMQAKREALDGLARNRATSAAVRADAQVGAAEAAEANVALAVAVN